VSVEFDWTKVIRREETFRDVLGFFHTHPQGLTRPSRRDVRTMQAWCDCLGKPLLCIIGEPGSADMQIHGYLFRNFRSRGRKVELMARDNQQIVFKE
jgi:proteasome lid subunit RPN8/RPN11